MSDHTSDGLAKMPVSTREEVQNNFAMVMQPYGNIEDLISPAPLSIALLGQLILLSLETDLSLIGKDDSPPKYLTHPRSLRASLLQVNHAAWDAFNLAHKKMDAIRLKTANIPILLNDSVTIIFTGTTDEMEVMLSKAMQNIKGISADCTRETQVVERKFFGVVEIINELLELCRTKCGGHTRNDAADTWWSEGKDANNSYTDEANVSSQSAAEAAVRQARMKCEQASLVMRQTMEQYTATQKRLQEASREMTAFVAQISQCELTEALRDERKEQDFGTIIQSIHVMGNVNEQLSKLIQYFQMTSNMVECSLQTSLNRFPESAESSLEFRMKKGGQYNLSKVMRDVIYLQASTANQIAHLVQGLSGTYVEVSDKHILRPLSGLDKLMALDADEDKTRIKEKQRELQQRAEYAAEAIKDLVRERHDEIMEKGYDRINKYEKTMREALPPQSAAELRGAAANSLSEPSVDIDGW